MGCSNHKRELYTDVEYDEEIEIRKFEEEMGAFRKNLNTVLPRICIEKDLISVTSVENYILRDFSENFLKLVQFDYFYKIHDGKKYYDAKKLKYLLFLLTCDSMVDSVKTKYHDKASFIITNVKINEDEDLSFPIQKDDANFLQFIDDIVDISIIGLVDAYNHLKNVQREGYMNKIRKFKEQTSAALIRSIFISKKKDSTDGITFKDINDKFEKDRWVYI